MCLTLATLVSTPTVFSRFVLVLLVLPLSVESTSKDSRIASATTRPSTAALTMPSANPAPSPEGNNPDFPIACKVSESLQILTGVDVLGVGACGAWLLDPSIAGAWESERRFANWMSSGLEQDGTPIDAVSVGLPSLGGEFKQSKTASGSGIGVR